MEMVKLFLDCAAAHPDAALTHQKNKMVLTAFKVSPHMLKVIENEIISHQATVADSALCATANPHRVLSPVSAPGSADQRRPFRRFDLVPHTVFFYGIDSNFAGN